MLFLLKFNIFDAHDVTTTIYQVALTVIKIRPNIINDTVLENTVTNAK